MRAVCMMSKNEQPLLGPLYAQRLRKNSNKHQGAEQKGVRVAKVEKEAVSKTNILSGRPTQKDTSYLLLFNVVFF